MHFSLTHDQKMILMEITKLPYYSFHFQDDFIRTFSTVHRTSLDFQMENY